MHCADISGRGFYCCGVIEMLTPQALIDRVRFDRSSLSVATGLSAVIVDCSASDSLSINVHRNELVDLPIVIIGWCAGKESASPENMTPEIMTKTNDVFDVVVDDESLLSAVKSMIAERPLAAVATAMLLRRVDLRSVEDSLVAESTTYSLLQSGPEFRQWREARDALSTMHPPDRDRQLVTVERNERELVIMLNRPDRRNAYSSAMRSALADALGVAVFDPSVESVTLCGAGTNFSSGGDLDEFGQFNDPVTAHFSRLTSRVTRALWVLRQRLGDRLRCHTQGENFGAGVELAAFAGRVSASYDARFTLPEVKMGLIPGSGGTASLPMRIGRHRTALLALSGLPIDAETALEWGLVDDIIR